MLLGSYKSRERRLEHQLTKAEVASARARRDRFILACKSNHCPLSTATIHRAYIEALEELARGDKEESIPTDPHQYERRNFHDSAWSLIDWPT